MSDVKMFKHKETFFQEADDGIPSHWVVQYYDVGSKFPCARYFGKEKDALTFEREITRELTEDN